MKTPRETNEWLAGKLPTKWNWVVVSNILYFHPYLGRWSNLTNIFQMGWNHQLGNNDLYHLLNITVAFRGIAIDVSVNGGVKSPQDCKDNSPLDLLVEHA